MPTLECGFSDTPPLSGADALAFFGPTALVDIGFDGAANYADLGGTMPASQAAQIPALLDTGAGESCIDDVLAVGIGLPVIDRAIVAGVGGQTQVNIYLAHMIVPGLSYVQWGRFAGVHLTAGGQSHRALIGRSLLKDILMVYDGRDGRVKLAF